MPSEVAAAAPVSATVLLSEREVMEPVRASASGAAKLVYSRVERPAMGSLFEIYLAGTDRDALIGAANEALDEVERLEAQLSHYRPDSDISRLNANAHANWVRLEPTLFNLLKRCANWSAETAGAFDITAGSLVRLWGFFSGEMRVPSDEEIDAALAGVGSQKVCFDDEDHLVHFSVPGMEINLGGVGKGFALDEAIERLRFYEVSSAVLNAGSSSIYALGSSPGEEGWTIDLKDPRDKATIIQTIVMKDEALSTSGGYEDFFEHEGNRYSHLLDPRTGKPVQGMVSASVVAPTGAEAEALSTAFFVNGVDWARDYCRNRMDVRAVILEGAPNEEMVVTRIGFAAPTPGS